MDGTVPFLRPSADIARDRAERAARNAADIERAAAYGAAETLCALLDRHPGNAGADPAAIEAITRRITTLCAEVGALLGEPAHALIGRDGTLIGLVREPPR